MKEMKLEDLKLKTPKELLSFAEETGVENASTMRKQELMFATLKQLAAQEVEITGTGVVEVLQDGFGFLRSPDANYLPGPDDIYVSPSQIRRFALRSGDTVEGQIRSPKDGERYFALLKVSKINFEDPEATKHKVHFDNLTPLYPDERFNMELEVPTSKDMSTRVIDLVAPLGKGQRALIVAPPRTGKTVLLQNIAHSITSNHPQCYLTVLLTDHRPEEDRRTADEGVEHHLRRHSGAEQRVVGGLVGDRLQGGDREDASDAITVGINGSIADGQG